MEMTAQEVPNIDANMPLKNPDSVLDGLSMKHEDLQADLAKLAEQMGQNVPNPSPSVVAEIPKSTEAQPVAQVETPAQAVEKTEVPAKFVDKDGKPDTAKIEKSTSEAIKEYLKIEAELRKAQSAKAELAQQATIPAAQPVPQYQAPDLYSVTPQAIVEELKINGWNPNDPSTLGQAQAVTMLKLAHIAQQTAYAKAMQDANAQVGSIRDRVESEQKAKELEAICKNDPAMVSPEGIQALAQIKNSNPNMSWTDAYTTHLGRLEMQKRFNSQVQPTPKAKTAQPPATPVEAVNNAVSRAPAIDYTDRKAIDSAVAKLPQDKQLDFLRQELQRRGFSLK